MIDREKFQKERVSINSISSKDEKKSVIIAGWLYDDRDIGKIRFALIRDITGEIQVTGVKGETNELVFNKLGKIPRESVIIVKGKVVSNKKAPGGREIIPESLEVLAEAKQPLPIDTSDFSKTELSKRLDYRFLDFHRKRTQAIFKIQSTITQAFREHFSKKGFIEIQPPCLISAASEGGADLFKVKYFEKEACLAQSPQLYKQMLACSLEKVSMVAPVWRAEKHNTIRHINEIRQMDIEAAFYDMFAIMKQEEELMIQIIKTLLQERADELSLLRVELKIPSSHYISYTETIELLKKNKVKIYYGEDLTPDSEKKLEELFPNTLLFVHSWPLSLRAFYIMPKKEDLKAELSEGFDLIYKGLEITSGGQRIHIPELLIARLKAKGLNPKDFTDYIDSFRYGAPYHSGWSIGLERLTMVLTAQENIRETTMFPRDRDRLTP